MIISEVKVKTRLELKVLFTKLDREGYTWYSGKNLLEWMNIAMFSNDGAYLQITDTKRVLWNTCPLPRSEWSKWT